MFRKRQDTYLASEIAAFLGKKLQGKDCAIEGVSSIDHIADNSLLFFSEIINNQFDLREDKALNFDAIEQAQDILLLADKTVCDRVDCACIASEHPRLDFVKILSEFFAAGPPAGIHPTAVIEEGAVIGEDVGIGAHCYIGARVRVGRGTRILHNVVINGDTTIGEECVLKSNSTIGSEGFSFVYGEDALTHFPQIGRIVIGNKVWLGSNVCVECAALEETRIEDDVKIDDLVQIGHNSTIGKGSQITAGVIICGRVVLEEGCWIAPNAVIDNNVRVGRESMIGTGSVIRKDVSPRSVMAGVPGRLLRTR